MKKPGEIPGSKPKLRSFSKDDNKFNTGGCGMSLLDLLDRPIAYHRSVAKAVGSVTAGILMSQAMFWSKRTSNPDGWFYKSQAEWEDETALTRREQETARKTLRSLNLLEEKKEGIPCRLFFKVNLFELEKLLSVKQYCRQISEDPKYDASNDGISRLADSAILGSPNPPVWHGEIVHAGMDESATLAWRNEPDILYTKNTSKNTSKNTQTSPQARGEIEPFSPQLELVIESFPLAQSDPGFTDETFGAFWSQTVMKVNREKARLAFLRVGKNVKGISFELVLEAWTQQQRRHMEEKGTVQYLRRAEAWLNGHCWEDCEDPFVQAGIKPEDVRRELKKAQLVAMLQESNREKQESYA
jgi:hypothetical protein